MLIADLAIDFVWNWFDCITKITNFHECSKQRWYVPLKAISIKSSYRKCILLLQQDSDRGVKYGIWQKKITTTTAKPSTTTLYYYFILLKFYAEMSYNNALRKSLSVIGMHRIFWHFGQHDANSKFAKKPKMMLFKVHRLQ